MDLYRFTAGTVPVLISVPHCGTALPDDMRARLTPAALAVPDTDWHVDRLYEFAPGLGTGYLCATQSRYVVDLNRDLEGKPLYPGADNTEVCPSSTFASEPIYRDGPPDEAEIARRIAAYWRPYHERLAGELKTLRAKHRTVVLFDAHSIVSVAPRFFEGRLPDFNLGTARGASADPTLAAALMDILGGHPGHTSILNGRFTGGYITRHYGDPAGGVHAVQLEMAQCAYMDEAPPYQWRQDLADGLRPMLRRLIEKTIAWAVERG